MRDESPQVKHRDHYRRAGHDHRRREALARGITRPLKHRQYRGAHELLLHWEGVFLVVPCLSLKVLGERIARHRHDPIETGGTVISLDDPE
jgi:hypothetical protein